MELATLSLNLEARHRFHAFNTTVTIVAADWRDAAHFARLERFFAAVEARFSRFRSESELSRLNQGAGGWIEVSAEMLAQLERCRHFVALTDGVFNPLVLRALEAAGYDRSFELIEGARAVTASKQVPLFGAIPTDKDGRRVRLPLHCGLDFGGIGKGHAGDEAMALLPETSGLLIDAGGDVYAAGRGPDGAPWRIEVADPLQPDRVLDRIELSDAAVASSWTTRRRWQTGDGWTHHLIDPRTGRPAASGLAGVTVTAARCDEADVFAKTALILGPNAGLDFLQGQGVEGLLILDNGTQLRTPGWPGEQNTEVSI